MPGVFAMGDVRHGSGKRVAASVGDGSVAVRLLHEYLAQLGEQNKPWTSHDQLGRAESPRLR
jgi:hypothetical protein